MTAIGLISAHDFGGLVELLHRNTGDLADLLRRILHDGCFEFIEVLAAFFDEGFIFPAFFQDDVHQSVEQGNIRAGFLA